MTNIFNPDTLKGKNILITGASSGIGRSIAIECGRLGASVILTGRNLERLKETALHCVFNGGGVNDCKSIDYHSLDISDESHFEEVISKIPPLDGIVHSAGINDKYLVKTLTREKIEKVFNTNVIGPMLFTKDLIKMKKVNTKASMVFISSISASFATISNAVYASSKGALESFCKVLALELAPRKIRVNVIRPGTVETPILKAYALKEELENFKSQYPLGRVGEPEEIASLTAYLLSDDTEWMTGSIVTMDGGITLR